ncbi:TonB-dependent receptor [Sphingomonas panaciterrae]|uniref:TonB-dependent receptor n=1 Tax=Sphingomonas panaciterrae TaxID=1462999 RepID=UPI002FEEDEC3
MMGRNGAARRQAGLRALLLGSVMAVTPSLAAAQDAPPPPAESPSTEASAPSSGADGEIVVTALRRNTRIQDTPIAISATSGETLAASGTTSFTELTRTAPSLRIVDSGPGSRRVLIRGITSAGEPTVGVYYDETPVSGSVGTTSDSGGSTPDFRLFDVERAEVLRGPQGTLFGSGSMGGTLRIIFEKPKADRLEAAFSGNMTAVEGGGPGFSLDGMINLPIVEDKIALRIVGNYNKFAGYVDNIILTDDPNAGNVADTSPDPRYLRNVKNINDGESYGGRALLRITPTEDLTIDLSATYEHVDAPIPLWRPDFSRANGFDFASNMHADNINEDNNRIFSGTIRYDFDAFSVIGTTSYFDRDFTRTYDVSDTFNGRVGTVQNAEGRFVNTLNSAGTREGCRRYQLGITSAANPTQCTADQLTGYFNATVPLQSSALYQPQKLNNWVHELRLSSTSDSPFQWTVGGFLESRDTEVRSLLLVASPETGAVYSPSTPGAIAYDRTINDELRQKAAYAELSYKLADQLTLTAGARYFNFERKVGGRIDVGQIHYSSRVTPYTEANYEEDGLIYKFNVSWQPTTRLLFYAQAAQGFRPGGVNQVIGLPAERAAYTSDSLWNYEIGAKTTLARGVYLNLAGYRIDWDNLQVSARTAGTGSVFGLISNAGAARVWGAEAELSANLLPGLSFNGAVGYTDAKLSEDQVSDFVVATGRRGDRIPNVPRISASASLDYKRPVSDTLTATARVDASHVGSFYSTLSPTDIYRRKIPAYELVNLRFGIEGVDSDWGVYLFANNLLNDTAINQMSANANTGGITNAVSIAPRTYGLNLMRRF